MIVEMIVTGIVSLIIGAIIMKFLLRSKRIESLVDRSGRNKYKAMKDPELLLEKLNQNGMMIDDGDEISFSVEVKDGKKQLVQKVKKNAVTPGVAKIVKKAVKDVQTEQKE